MATTPGADPWTARMMAWSAMLCALLAAVLWLGPYLIRADVFSDDAAQHVFWMYRLADPGLFPGDLTVRYFSDSSSAPWGYQALYFVLAQVLDVQLAAECVAVVLLLASAWMAWQLGRACGGERPELRALGALVAMLLLLPLTLTDIMSPLGLQRSFALLLSLLCLWALVTRRYAWVGVAWLAAALFYPVILVVLGLSGGLIFGYELWRERRLPPASVWNMVLGGTALLIAWLNSIPPTDIGPTVTGDAARSMPEFNPGGRVPMFNLGFFSNWFNDHHLALGWSPYSLLTIAIELVLVHACRRGRDIPPAVWVTALVGLGVWFLSRQMLFTLYLPNRHARWSLAVFAIVAWSAAACAVLQRLIATLRQSSVRAQRVVSLGVALLAPVVVMAALLPGSLREYRQPRDENLEQAYRFIASLPKQTLVAAHPDLADFVPFRTRRSVLASTETALPFMSGYYKQLRPRIAASLRAAYATDIGEVDAALAPFGVDVMLSSGAVWSDADLFAPYDQLSRELRARGERLGFVMRAPPADRLLFHSGDVYVIRVRPAHTPQ